MTLARLREQLTSRGFVAYAPDESAGGDIADTPQDGTGTQDAAQGNWEERYKEAQAWGTRLSQQQATLEQEAELARNLRDPEKRAEALAALGLGLVPDEDQTTDEQIYDNDPRVLAQLQALQERLDKQDQRTQQQTAAQQEQENYQAYRQITDPQLKQLGVPDQLHEVIAGLALELPEIHGPQGTSPDLQGAWNQFLQFSEALDDVPDVRTRQMKKYAASKPQRALVTPNGRAGTDVPDLKTHEGRMAAAMSRMAAERM